MNPDIKKLMNKIYGVVSNYCSRKKAHNISCRLYKHYVNLYPNRFPAENSEYRLTKFYEWLCENSELKTLIVLISLEK
jgi:hypothetical protein